jgi:hypothetical protein
LERHLSQEGFAVFSVAGSAIRDDRTLFKAFEAAGALTSISPVEHLNWNGFTDELWDALAAALVDRRAPAVAVVWLDAHVACSRDQGLVLRVVETFLHVAAQVGRRGHRSPAAVLRLYLLGEGPGFEGAETA